MSQGNMWVFELWKCRCVDIISHMFPKSTEYQEKIIGYHVASCTCKCVGPGIRTQVPTGHDRAEHLELRRMTWQEDGEDAFLKLHNLYSSPNIIRTFKSRMMILERHVA
jgi:hypothetical protein